MIPVNNDHSANMPPSHSPTVSVVMVTYNHAPYIEEAITSILAQDFSGSFELIIGDDCSVDGTADIVRRFHELHPTTIKLISSENNIGADANFRRCIEACTGEYIAFCEGDDFWSDAEKLEKQITTMQSNPDIGAVHSDFNHTILLKNQWKTLKAYRVHHKQHIPDGQVLENLIGNNFIQTCTLCMRTKIAKEYFLLPLPLESYSVGDWPLCIFTAVRNEVEYIPEPLATYRKTPGSILNAGYDNGMFRSEACMSMISDFCGLYGLPKTLEQGSHIALLKQALFFSLLSGNAAKFEYYWESIRKIDPASSGKFRPGIARFIIRYRPLHRFYMQYRSIRDYFYLLFTYR